VPHRSATILAFLERRPLAIVLVLIAIASVRIAATYTVFNHTSDEPAHIACGMEWLDKGLYQWEPQHPPLARVAAALGPYLLGIRCQGTPRNVNFAFGKEGAAILYRDHHYDLTLASARSGVLPFFWIACLVVYWWGARYFRAAVGVAAVAVFSFLEPVLAHAGLATTDMALTAFLSAAFLCGLIWLEHPTPRHATQFGAAAGLMVISKFSCMVFFPASLGVALTWYWLLDQPQSERKLRALIHVARERAPSLGLAIAIACLVIWAGYRFSFGPVGRSGLRVPAPEVIAGLRQVQEHNAAGHEGYLLGTRSMNGFWCFYLVGMGVKTPLAVLLLLGYSIVLLFRNRLPFQRAWLPLAFIAGIMLVGMFSRINIGIRHVLPIYVGIALLAAVALIDLLQASGTKKWAGPVMALLVLWFAGTSLASHPDYLPYFNELAGSEPERILADSDLDWGQDLKRLAKRLREAGATDVAFDKYIIGDWEKEHGFPRIHMINQLAPSVGWNAVGVGLWKESNLVLWADRIKPQERVGKSILLWYFPPVSAGGSTSNRSPARR